MAETYQPQLVMRRHSLAGLPALELPAGVTIRHYGTGDDETWLGIIAESFGWRWTPDEFVRRMSGAEPWRDERCKFVCLDGEAVGTATIWQVPRWGDEVGYLHMVGVLPRATGRRLGGLVSLACLQGMCDEGFGAAMLQTDDHRLPAVRTYLRLGFEPLLVHENQRERWRRVLREVGWSGRESWFDGPIVEPPQG